MSRADTPADTQVPVALADYSWVRAMPVVDGDFDGNGHVDNVGVARLFHEARREWLLSLDGRPPGFIYVVRHLEIAYLGEAFPDAVMRVGVRMTARGRTSLTLEHTLCADDVVAATGTAVHVAFAREEHHTVELWPAVLASIEARQGELPPLSVPGG